MDVEGHVTGYGYDACSRLTSVTGETEGSLVLEYTGTGADGDGCARKYGFLYL